MTRHGTSARLTVLVNESDQARHHPVYTEIVHRAHRAGLAGASVFHGIEGFGRSRHIHTTRLLSLSQDLPAAVVIVDTEERIRAFLPDLDDIDGLVLLEPVEVVRHGSVGGGVA